MTIYLPYLVSAMALSAIIAFITQRRHILMSLLSLEAVILSLALLLTLINSSTHSMDLFYCLVILTFGACEASVALAILVSISRTYGSDMMSSLTTNKC